MPTSPSPPHRTMTTSHAPHLTRRATIQPPEPATPADATAPLHTQRTRKPPSPRRAGVRGLAHGPGLPFPIETACPCTGHHSRAASATIPVRVPRPASHRARRPCARCRKDTPRPGLLRPGHLGPEGLRDLALLAGCRDPRDRTLHSAALRRNTNIPTQLGHRPDASSYGRDSSPQTIKLDSQTQPG